MGELKVLILGDGLLGSEIVKQTGWDYLSRKKDDFDIDDYACFESIKNIYNANIIINCIANTDTYSNDRESHWHVNYVFVNRLIKFCNENNIKLIHISTDYIYAGSVNNASEDDIPMHCNNWYGYTKLLGDGLVQLQANNYLICRCTHKPFPFPYDNAWIDQVGNFDYVDVIANIIIEMVSKNLSGVYNVGTDTKTMYDLALMSRPVEASFTPSHVPKNQSMNLTKLNNNLKN